MWSATEEEKQQMARLRAEGKEIKEIAEIMGKTYWQVAHKIKDIAPVNRAKEVVEQVNRQDSVEKLPNGTHKSTKLLEMDDEQNKDEEYLLKAHGFEVDKFEIVQYKNNIWNTYSKEDKVQTLYSSKITVRPKEKTFTKEHLTEIISNMPSITYNIQPIELSDKRLLEIPLFDTHFGVSDYDHYEETQSKIHNVITSRHWEEILFIVGQDLFHNNDLKGKTANGTPIEQVDMKKAWNNALKFYTLLISKAIKQSNKVKVIYSKGNHDEFASWCFVQILKAHYKDIEVDDHIEERKVHTFGEIFIGVTHGDKARKNLHNIFPVEFPQEWSKAKVKEIHCGHYHVEDAKDVYGMMVRTLATRNKTDQWHKDNGFVGAHKRFMLFEYSESELESIHYV